MLLAILSVLTMAGTKGLPMAWVRAAAKVALMVSRRAAMRVLGTAPTMVAMTAGTWVLAMVSKMAATWALRLEWTLGEPLAPSAAGAWLSWGHGDRKA
jgi:hypothetical protein